MLARGDTGDGDTSRTTLVLRLACGAALFWGSFVFFAVAYAIVRYGDEYAWAKLAIDLPVVLLCTALGTLFALLLRAVLRRTAHLALLTQIALIALLAGLACPVYSLMGETLLVWLSVTEVADLTVRKVVAGSIFFLAPMGVWAAIQLALFHHAEARARERRLAALQIEAHEAQVRALRYQVNPHFLYNTLNSVAALILDRRNDEAEHMVLRLADFFRAGLARDPLADASLAEEVAAQKLYLEVEQLRFGDALRVDIDVPAELATARLPSLILQPLVENALKHAARDDGSPLCVSIAARPAADRLILEVRDNGSSTGGEGRAGTGTGLRNVAGRLASRFGTDARLDALATGEGFVARLDLPWEKPE